MSADYEQGITVERMLDEVATVKPMHRKILYNNIRALGIKPIGARQHPQLYPGDTAQKILARYDLAPRRLARA